MATFKTDFSEYTVGSQPSDWTAIWVTTNDTWTIADVADATDGKTLRHTATADARRLITWDTVGTINGDFDILLKWKTTDSISGNIPARIFAYASGSATQSTQQGYQLDALFTASLRIGRTVNGSYSTLASNTNLPIAFQPNTWYWYRFQKVGNTLQGKVWKDGDIEQSTWDVSTTSTSLSSGGVGIGSYDYDGTRDYDYFSIGTNGDSAPSPVDAPPPDTTAPAEITNLTEDHTDIAIEFHWTNPTDSDFYAINAYRNGEKVAGDLGTMFTDATVSPDTTYTYRFTTVDYTGNESVGTEITVTTDPQKQYKHLKPIEIISLNNFTPNDITYIQDDPMNEDANVITTIDNLSNPSIRLRFETPDSPISGLQTMRWVVDDPYYVGSRITIYDSGVQVYQSAMKYPLGGTQPIVENFNADVLTDKTMQNVEVVLEATVYQGDTIANLGAIEWTYPIDETSVPIEGSIVGTSSISASLSKSYNVSGSLSVASTIDASVLTDRGLQGNSDTATSVNGTLFLNKELEGNLVSSSTLEADPIIDRGLQATSISVSEISTPLLERSFGVSGNSTSFSSIDGMGAVLKDMEGQVNSSSSINAEIELEIGLTVSVEVTSTLQANVTIDRGLNGNLVSVSEVSNSHLERSFEIVGSLASSSSMNGTMALFQEMTGNCVSSSNLEADITIDRGLNGQFDVHSSVNNPVLGLFFNVIGNVALVSDSASVIGIDRGIEGEIISQSSLSVVVEGFKDLESATSSFSHVSGELGITREIIGNVDSVSAVSNAQISLYRELEANVIQAQSTISPVSLLKAILIDGYIEADSIHSGMIEKEMTLQGYIFEDSSVTGAVNRSMLIDGMVASGSSAEIENLFIYREIDGTVNGVSSLTSSFFVEGEVILTGRIINQSIISSSLTALKPLEGDAGADSFAHVEYMEVFRSINGEIIGDSSVESSLNKFMGIGGMIDEFSSLDGMASRFIPMDSSIDISSTMNSMLQKELLLSSSIEVNSSMDSLLNKLVRLDSLVQAYSALQDADLLRWMDMHVSVHGQSSIDAIMSRLRSMSGGIDAYSILSVEFSVEGEIWLDGSIFTLSSIEGFSNIDRSITGMIESDSGIYPAFLNRGISIDGDIISQSEVSVFLSRLYGMEGSTGAISDIDGEINKRRSMSGRISSQNSIEADMRMLWGMNGQVEGNADLEAESMVFYDLGGGLVAQSSLSGQTMILLDLTTETIAAVSSLFIEGLVNVSPPKIDVIRLNGQMMVRIQLEASQDIVSRLKAEHETVVRLDGDLSG